MEIQRGGAARGNQILRPKRDRSRLLFRGLLLVRRAWSSAADDGAPKGPRSSKGPTTRRRSTSRSRRSGKPRGIKPAKAASDEEFLRRVYLDMLGRIPNVAEANAFLHTRESDKREKLVEYLLNHPDFAKNFATQWTILLDRPRQSGPDGRPPVAVELAAETGDGQPALERSRP